MRSGFRRAICSALVATALPVGFAPLVIAQRFSEWSAPVNLGSMVNSSAFDG